MGDDARTSSAIESYDPKKTIDFSPHIGRPSPASGDFTCSWISCSTDLFRNYSENVDSGAARIMLRHGWPLRTSLTAFSKNGAAIVPDADWGQSVGLKLRPHVKHALDEACAKEGRSRNNLVGRVITAWLRDNGYLAAEDTDLPPPFHPGLQPQPHDPSRLPAGRARHLAMRCSTWVWDGCDRPTLNYASARSGEGNMM
jgi:hypothetical protein